MPCASTAGTSSWVRPYSAAFAAKPRRPAAHAPYTSSPNHYNAGIFPRTVIDGPSARTQHAQEAWLQARKLGYMVPAQGMVPGLVADTKLSIILKSLVFFICARNSISRLGVNHMDIHVYIECIYFKVYF